MKNQSMRLPMIFVSLSFIFMMSDSVSGTALDDYVSAPDPDFGYVPIGSSSYDPTTFTRAYVLELTSQQWRNTSEVDHTVWKHWVTIIVPELDWLLGQTQDTALLIIGGGDSTDPAPEIDPNYRLIAAGTRSVIVGLSAVPNQPLQFSDEVSPRSEDEIIAYSWDKFLKGGDANWPVQLPMVKSVVRCMDAVQSFVGKEAVNTKTINHFVLTGGSKRGWIAWLTAAVDPKQRVTAIAPIVSDLLNMKRNFSHQWAAYGFWADALMPYKALGIFEWFDTSEVDELLAIVDPFQYLDRLQMPKFIVNAAGDDFFVSDSIRFYFSDLQGEAYLRHVPNTDHYLTDAFEDVFNTMVPYYEALLNGNQRPVFSWTMQADGSIRVDTVDVPKAVILWQASNPTARDFRLVTIGKAWHDSPLTDQGDGVYLAEVNEPDTGWTAFFVELVYDSPFLGPNLFDYHFTTEMRVIPETLPFEADFNRDRITDLRDITFLSDAWLSDRIYWDIAPRMGGDGIINFQDFSIFAMHWLESNIIEP